MKRRFLFGVKTNKENKRSHLSNNIKCKYYYVGARNVNEKLNALGI